MQCSAVQCSAVQCSAVQCSAVQCSAVQYSTVQYSTGHTVQRFRVVYYESHEALVFSEYTKKTQVISKIFHVMQRFRVVFRGISHVSLEFSLLRCIPKKYMLHVAHSMVNNEKVLHYYFIPRHRKILIIILTPLSSRKVTVVVSRCQNNLENVSRSLAFKVSVRAVFN